MTIDEFLDRLRQTPRHWSLEAGSLRLVDRRLQRRDDSLTPEIVINCPISCLTGCEEDFSTPSLAAQAKLGMSPENAQALWLSADNICGHPRFSAVLRAKLLEACGLVSLLNKQADAESRKEDQR